MIIVLVNVLDGLVDPRKLHPKKKSDINVNEHLFIYFLNYN